MRTAPEGRAQTWLGVTVFESAPLYAVRGIVINDLFKT
jgi:hypothetical protein